MIVAFILGAIFGAIALIVIAVVVVGDNDYGD